jgi:Zn-dependent metalloprotease
MRTVSPLRLAALLTAAAAIMATGVVQPVLGQGGRAVSIAASSTGSLRDWDARLVRMEREGSLARTDARDDAMAPGYRHERLAQRHAGVPVFGAGVVRSSRDGSTTSLLGLLYDGIELDVEPALTATAALAAAARAIGTPPAGVVRPDLVVLPREDGSFALAWRVSYFTGADLPVVFVNARSGLVERRYSNLQRQAAVGRGRGVLGDEKKISTKASSGAYFADDQLRPPRLLTLDLRGDLWRAVALLTGTETVAPSDVAADTDNDWTDTACVDAHVHLGWTYDYWFKRMGWRGLDDRDAPMRAIVHPVKRQDMLTVPDEVFALMFINAFWAGDAGADGRGFMVFGEGMIPGYYLTGSGQYLDFVAGGLDVVAHELAHGVTDNTSNLIYMGESGALNESFSDIMGTAVEFYFQASGNGLARADYVIGEDIARPYGPGSRAGFRSLADPAAFGDPDHYSLRYRGEEDGGGVHTNSGIPNHAFYLAVEGGRNRVSGLSVQGVGAANREQIEKAFFRAFVHMLPSSATFSDARQATIQSARELYGAGSGAERAIAEAWTAVGVF